MIKRAPSQLDHALLQVRTLNDVLARAFDDDCSYYLAPRLTSDLASILDDFLEHIGARACNPDHILADELNRRFSNTLAFASELAEARDLDLDLDLARSVLYELVRAIDSAALEASAGVARGTHSTPGQVTQKLVALAVLLLPAEQRTRYREEFGFELVELPRGQRLGYAMRLLARAWELRMALVAAVYTSCGESGRQAEL